MPDDPRGLVAEARTAHRPAPNGTCLGCTIIWDDNNVDTEAYPCLTARLATTLEHWHGYARHLKDTIIPEISTDLLAERNDAYEVILITLANLNPHGKLTDEELALFARVRTAVHEYAEAGAARRAALAGAAEDKP